tara:strand:- start:498 stop:1544 length:1047 start_codon:yes stop_codon:yes gene_type:complete
MLIAEYVWLDGCKPTQQLRSKTKVINTTHELNNIEPWGFDGSSTEQSEGSNSDLVLKPVRFINNPLERDSIIVLCEVMEADASTPHPSNTRAHLRNIINSGAAELDSLWGFEQEYVLKNKDSNRICGWTKGYPAPQGQYYCGNGAENVSQREISIEHLYSCIDANLLICGTNAEVMLGQWEFQIGHRNITNDQTNNLKACPLMATDHLWLARLLLIKIAENQNVSVDFSPKPIAGDWNGSGMHTNFSTIATRTPHVGLSNIKEICTKLEKHHAEHMIHYGADNINRMTGLHETCKYTEFKSGINNRGASVRIPNHVSLKGYGYLEDRRPAANADPYVVTTTILKTLMQ